MKTCDWAKGSPNFVGDPIDVVSGANVDQTRDFLFDGPFPVEWKRYYDSRWNAIDRGLGYGHRHVFDHWLRWDLDGISHISPAGYESYFAALTQDGQRHAGGGYLLERVNEETYLLHRHAEPSREFHRPRGSLDGRLVALARRASDGRSERVALQYDRDGLLEKILAPRDETLKVEYDDDGRVIAVWHWPREGDRKALIRYRYDAAGCLVEGRDAYAQTFSFAYDEGRRITRRTDRRGYSFLFEYDGDGRCVHAYGEDGVLSVQLEYRPTAYETSVIDANGGDWLYQYLPSGVVVFITDPYGAQRRFEFDDDGKLVAEYDEHGAVTRYRFDAAGCAVAKVTVDGDLVPLPEDESAPGPRAHRVPGIPIEWELGDLWDTQFKLPDEYDVLPGLPSVVAQSLVKTADPRRGTVEEARDLQGLLLRESIEGGLERTYGYNENGGLRRVTDFDGRTWKLAHASWNHIVEETDPLNHRTTYEHSPTEKVLAVVDPAGTRTDYGYDLKDRLVEVRRGGPIRETYVYDEADNLTEKRDANGELLLSMEYDLKGHITRRTFASGEEHEFRYDRSGRFIVATARLHECTFAYDYAGRRVADKRNGKGVEHRFVGETLARTKVLDRFTTEYHHLDNGTLVLVDPAGGTHRIRRHGSGIFTRDFANGWSETVQYHPRGGLVLAKIVYAQDRPEARWERRYRYSGEGDLLEVHDSEQGVTQHEHDAAHRLARTVHPDGRADDYAYNAAGSLFRSPTLDGTLGQENRLRYANGDKLEYDHRHHVCERTGSRGVFQYDHDSRDQLTGIFWTAPDGRTWGWDAEYDPLGRRIRKSPGYTNDTTYYWDTDRLAAEVFHDGRVRVYVYPDAFAMVPLLFIDYASEDADPASGARYYVFTDQRGCPERIVNDAGELAWKARIDPYGWARVEVGHGFHQPLRFPGHFWDSETELHYNRFRYYSPELGRYLESDPWGIGAALDVYAYTANPLVYADVLGLGCETVLQRRVVRNPDGSETVVEVVRTASGQVLERVRIEPPRPRPQPVVDQNIGAGLSPDESGHIMNAATRRFVEEQAAAHVRRQAAREDVDAQRRPLVAEREAARRELAEANRNARASFADPNGTDAERTAAARAQQQAQDRVQAADAEVRVFDQTSRPGGSPPLGEEGRVYEPAYSPSSGRMVIVPSGPEPASDAVSRLPRDHSLTPTTVPGHCGMPRAVGVIVDDAPDYSPRPTVHTTEGGYAFKRDGSVRHVGRCLNCSHIADRPSNQIETGGGLPAGVSPGGGTGQRTVLPDSD